MYLSTKAPQEQPALLLRYRIRRLQDPDTARKLCEDFDRLSTTDPSLTSVKDVNELGAKLVVICQTVAGSRLGLTPTAAGQSVPQTSGIIREGQSIASTSVALFKAAVRSSKENNLLLASAKAQLEGVSAIDELHTALSERFRSPSQQTLQWPLVTLQPREDFIIEAFTEEQIAKEIKEQDSQKACAADGIYIRLLKVLADCSFPPLLSLLYYRCLATGCTHLLGTKPTSIC